MAKKAKKKTKKSVKKKHAGRPVGSPNVPYVAGTKELPRCRSCGSTDLKVLRKFEMPHTGLHDGQQYTSVIRHRVQCVHCKTVQMLTSYAYNPDEWQGSDDKTPF